MLSRSFPSRVCGLRKTGLFSIVRTAFLFGLGILVQGTAFSQRPYGIDISSSQGTSVNWSLAKSSSSGISFAWNKATEGTTNYYSNPDFAANEASAKAAGVVIGPYHYARFDLNTGTNGAAAEAGWFWQVAHNYIQYGGAYLMPMLDVEASTTGYTQASLSDWVNAWCTTVTNLAAASGVIVRPVIYSSSSFAGTWFNSSVTQWIPWIAAWNGANPQTGSPGATSPWPSWTVWQYNDTNTTFSGVPPSCDVDVFNGTYSALLQDVLVGGTNAPILTLSPTNTSIWLGSNATLSVRASGPSPLGYRWLFNGTNLPGATSSNYIISNVQLTNAGGYSVVVSNSYASVPSGTAFLSVLSHLTNGNNCVLAPAGMTNWWPAEGNPNDIYGANNATPIGGFYYAQGKEGLAFHFDGTDSYLYTGAPSIPPSWTVCLWVNRQNAPGSAAALFGDNGNGTNELKLEQYGTSRLVGLTRFGVADYYFNYSVPVGTWTHLAFVGTTTNTSLYANGVNEGSLLSNGVPVNVSIPCPRSTIGCGYLASSNGKYIDFMLGALDEVMIFKAPLSQAQIQSIYNAGSGGLYRSPVFTGINYSSGFPQFTVRGQTGKNFSIYSSPDLFTWSLLTTISGASGSATYTDSSATGPQMFYRASQAP